jgi:hypothetical protein
MSSRTSRRLSHVPLSICGVLALLSLQCGSGSERDATDSAAQNSAGAASTAPAALTPGSPATAGSDSWSSYAQGFFASYCVSCHNDDNAGVAARDLHQRAVVDAEADEIACGLSKSSSDWNGRGCMGFPLARQFPAGNGAKPSDAERDRLIAWIDAGRP